MRISDWSSDVCSSDLPETRSWFAGQLEHIRSYLEYGAGASTLLAADRGIAAISIESDARYTRQVREALPADLGKYIVTIDIGVTEDWGYPLWEIGRASCRERVGKSV